MPVIGQFQLFGFTKIFGGWDWDRFPLFNFSSILQIYDLSVDALSPTFYFLLPSSKIRDVTFLFNEEGKNIIVIMSSAGYIYTQLMEEASSAQQGPFYVTNVLEINHEDLKVRAHVAISFYSRFNYLATPLFFFLCSFITFFCGLHLTGSFFLFLCFSI